MNENGIEGEANVVPWFCFSSFQSLFDTTEEGGNLKTQILYYAPQPLVPHQHTQPTFTSLNIPHFILLQGLWSVVPLQRKLSQPSSLVNPLKSPTHVSRFSTLSLQWTKPQIMLGFLLFAFTVTFLLIIYHSYNFTLIWVIFKINICLLH